MNPRIPRIRRAGVGALAALTAIVGLAIAPADAASNLTSTRFAGSDRFDTARLIAAGFGSSSTVVIARGDLFPDALAGSYLAGQNAGATLLTRSDSVPDSTIAALTATGATRAFILGGTTAINSAVESNLRGRGLTVERIGGATRYDTAQMVAAKPGAAAVGSWNGKKTAIVASGAAFPDALSGGPLAYAAKFPVILTAPGALSDQARAALTSLGITNVLLLGGPLAVSDAVKTSIEGIAGTTVTRIFGANRSATSVEVAKFARANLGFNANRLGVARGDDFADALSYGPLAGKLDPTVDPAAFKGAAAPNNLILTTNFNTCGPEALAEVTALQPTLTELEFVGGPNALTPECAAQLVTAGTGSGGTPTGPQLSFSTTSVAPGGSLTGTVTGAGLGAITVSGCGLTNAAVRSGEGTFNLTVPASQPLGACTLTFTIAMANGSPSVTKTQGLTITNTPTGVTLTNNSVAQGGTVSGNVTGPATIGAVTVSGCGLTNQAVRTGPGSFSFAIPASQAAGSCVLTFTIPDGTSSSSATQNLTVTTSGGGGVGGTQLRTAAPDLVSASVIDGVLNNGAPNTVRYVFDEDISILAAGSFTLQGYLATAAIAAPGGSASIDGADPKSAIVQYTDVTDVKSFTMAVVSGGPFPAGAVRDSGNTANVLGAKPLGGSSFSSASGQTAAPDLTSATPNTGTNQITYCYDEKVGPVGAGGHGFYDDSGTLRTGTTIVAAPTENCVVIGGFGAGVQVSTAKRFFASPAAGTIGAVSGLFNTSGHTGTATAGAPDLTGVTKVEGSPNQYDFTFDGQVTGVIPGGFFVYTDAGTLLGGSAFTQPTFSVARITFAAVNQNNVDLIVRGAVFHGAAVSNDAGAVPITHGAFPIARTANAATGFSSGPDLLSATFDPNSGQVTFNFDISISDAAAAPAIVPVPANFFVVSAGGVATFSTAGAATSILGKSVIIQFPSGVVAGAAGAGVVSPSAAQNATAATAVTDFNGQRNSPSSVGGGPTPA